MNNILVKKYAIAVLHIVTTPTGAMETSFGVTSPYPDIYDSLEQAEQVLMDDSSYIYGAYTFIPVYRVYPKNDD